MRGLRTAAWGLLIVVLDLRLEGFDFLPDLLGWALAWYALASLSHVHRSLGIAAIACLVGGATAVAELAGMRDSSTLLVVETLADLVVVFAVCTAVADLVPSEARLALRLRTWQLVTALVLVFGLVVTRPGDDATWLLVVGLVALVVYVFFLLMLFRVSRPPGTPTVSAPVDPDTLGDRSSTGP